LSRTKVIMARACRREPIGAAPDRVALRDFRRASPGLQQIANAPTSALR
jgi:hypothetical protein